MVKYASLKNAENTESPSLEAIQEKVEGLVSKLSDPHLSSLEKADILKDFTLATQELVARSKALSSEDSLTSLHNQGAGYKRIVELVADMLRTKVSDTRNNIGLLSIDLVNFKEYNNKYGHAAGNAALLAVAKAMQAAREEDIKVRSGGDEFQLVVKVSGPEDLRILAERLQQRLDNEVIEAEDPRTKEKVRLKGIPIRAGAVYCDLHKDILTPQIDPAQIPSLKSQFQSYGNWNTQIDYTQSLGAILIAEGHIPPEKVGIENLIQPLLMVQDELMRDQIPDTKERRLHLSKAIATPLKMRRAIGALAKEKGIDGKSLKDKIRENLRITNESRQGLDPIYAAVPPIGDVHVALGTITHETLMRALRIQKAVRANNALVALEKNNGTRSYTRLYPRPNPSMNDTPEIAELTETLAFILREAGPPPAREEIANIIINKADGLERNLRNSQRTGIQLGKTDPESFRIFNNAIHLSPSPPVAIPNNSSRTAVLQN